MSLARTAEVKDTGHPARRDVWPTTGHGLVRLCHISCVLAGAPPGSRNTFCDAHTTKWPSLERVLVFKLHVTIDQRWAVQNQQFSVLLEGPQSGMALEYSSALTYSIKMQLAYNPAILHVYTTELKTAVRIKPVCACL